MSVQSEIDRISSNIADSYDAVETMGGTLPEVENSNNLANSILSIPSGSGDAQPGDVVSGKTFTNDDGEQIGTLALSGNATESDVKSGKTFYSNDLTKKTGTLEVLSENTQTVSVSVSASASGREADVTFDSLDECKGITQIITSGGSKGMYVRKVNYGYWNCLNFEARRSQSSSGTATYTITGYQGQVSKNRVESKTITLNATSITIPFTNAIKCIKSISGTSSNRGWNICDATVSGNNIVLRCYIEDGSAQTCVIETYY